MKNTIISAIPGIFYRKPSPTEALYVEKGQYVEVGDTIGLIEVMKNFFEVKADVSGTIIEFEVESEEFVEAGQTLVVIQPKEGAVNA